MRDGSRLEHEQRLTCEGLLDVLGLAAFARHTPGQISESSHDRCIDHAKSVIASTRPSRGVDPTVSIFLAGDEPITVRMGKPRICGAFR